MKSSWKIFNLIFSLVILLIIGAGLYLVNSYNNTSWKNQEKAAIKSGEYAYESAYSYMELYSEKLTSGNLIALQTQIKNILGDTVTSVSLTDSPNNTISQYAQYNSDLQKIYINKGDRINLAIFVCINNFNDFYYLTVEKDFTPLSEIQLRNWRLFAYGAAGLIILGGALLIMVNLLKKESEKNKKFMENFAHELKTPMTSILGYSSMMSTYDLDEEEKNKALGALTFEAKRLDSLSKQMLELFVIQKENPEMLPVEAWKIEEALSISLKELSEKYGIPHTLDFAPGMFECNEILLLSLITNRIRSENVTITKGRVSAYKTTLKSSPSIFTKSRTKEI